MQVKSEAMDHCQRIIWEECDNLSIPCITSVFSHNNSDPTVIQYQLAVVVNVHYDDSSFVDVDRQLDHSKHPRAAGKQCFTTSQEPWVV